MHFYCTCGVDTHIFKFPLIHQVNNFVSYLTVFVSDFTFSFDKSSKLAILVSVPRPTNHAPYSCIYVYICVLPKFTKKLHHCTWFTKMLTCTTFTITKRAFSFTFDFQFHSLLIISLSTSILNFIFFLSVLPSWEDDKRQRGHFGLLRAGIQWGSGFSVRQAP